jgi:hypothetical protein
VSRHDFPDDYPPLSLCCSCGRDFSGDRMFDQHRVGNHEYSFEDGLRLEPPREDGRRCLDADEMREKGWRPKTDEEMLTSNRDRHRVGRGVELWFDPTVSVGMEQRLRHTGGRAKRTRGES